MLFAVIGYIISLARYCDLDSEESKPIPRRGNVWIACGWWNWLDSNQHHAAFQGRTQPLSYSSVWRECRDLPAGYAPILW